MSIDKISANDYISSYVKRIVQKNTAASVQAFPEKSDTVELSSHENSEKSNYIKWGLVAAGIAVVSAGIYYFSRGKAKPNNVFRNIPSEDNGIIRKFFNSKNELVQGVKLEKGKAVLADGSVFSGTLKVVKSAEKSAGILNNNGLEEEFAIFENGVKVYECQKNGSFNRSIRFFDTDGKTIKTIEEGCKHPEKVSQGNPDFYVEKTYDATGNVTKEFIGKTNGEGSSEFTDKNAVLGSRTSVRYPASAEPEKTYAALYRDCGFRILNSEYGNISVRLVLAKGNPYMYVKAKDFTYLINPIKGTLEKILEIDKTVVPNIYWNRAELRKIFSKLSDACEIIKQENIAAKLATKRGKNKIEIPSIFKKLIENYS